MRLSRNDLEQIGADVIRKYKSLLHVKRLDRLDIDCLAEKLLGLRIDSRHLSLAGDILGLTSFSEIGVEIFPQSADSLDESIYMLDGKTILIESNLTREGANIGRRNYTVSHETCHHILRYLFPYDYGSKAKGRVVRFYYRDRNSGTRDWEEWKVETLAGIILLPVECVLHSVDSFGLGAQIRLLNRVFAPEVYNRFVQMATFLGVSKTALAIRMIQLGLLQRNDLNDPYALISVEMDKEDDLNNECYDQNYQEVS